MPAGTPKKRPGFRDASRRCKLRVPIEKLDGANTLKRSYAGITQIRYKGQYLLGIHSQPALLPAPPGGYEFVGFASESL